MQAQDWALSIEAASCSMAAVSIAFVSIAVSGLVCPYTIRMGTTGTTPEHLDLKKDTGLTIRWGDGVESFYPIAYLRKMSPSAEMRELRKQMDVNPLTILPEGMGSGDAVVAEGAEMVGNYAIKISFSDGHATGLYSWTYLREIDPENTKDGLTESDQGPSHSNPLGL